LAEILASGEAVRARRISMINHAEQNQLPNPTITPQRFLKSSSPQKNKATPAKAPAIRAQSRQRVRSPQQPRPDDLDLRECLVLRPLADTLAHSVWSVSAPIANDVKPRVNISGKLALTGFGLTVKAIVTPWGKRSLKLKRRP